LKLALIHPAGKSDQQEPKRIENFRHLVALLSTDRKPGISRAFFNAFRFSGHTGSVITVGRCASIRLRS
jgi:hypothetical protein